MRHLSCRDYDKRSGSDGNQGVAPLYPGFLGCFGDFNPGRVVGNLTEWRSNNY
jgi:hypothetical protein